MFYIFPWLIFLPAFSPTQLLEPIFGFVNLFLVVEFTILNTPVFRRPTLWRRHSVQPNSSYNSPYDGFEGSYSQAFEGIDPREPDPVYVTLRDAARKRSDVTGTVESIEIN